MLDIQEQFDQFGEWSGVWVIDGKQYGSRSPEDQWRVEEWAHRVELFGQTFPSIGSVLEVSCWEGGLTARLAQKYDLVSVEGRIENIERAMFVLDVLDYPKVDFIQANFEEDDWVKSLNGRTFDAVFCCGILYHLSTPWKLLEQLSTLSDRIFIWTLYSSRDLVPREGYMGKWMEQTLVSKSGMVDRVFWLGLPSLLDAVGRYFPNVEILENKKGMFVTLAATK